MKPPHRTPAISLRLRELADQRRDHLALVDESGSWTYADLLDRSGAFTRALLDLDAGPGLRVGLLFGQERDMIAAQLGVLSAGGCFVPVDVNDPTLRQEKILRDCRPHLLFCGSGHEMRARHLEDATGTRAISAAAVPRGREGPLPEAPPGELASIFYTSGSTGEPKGVCQSQDGLAHYAKVYASALAIDGTDTLSLLFSPAFSAANMDVYGGLLCGATLALYDTKRKGLADLAAWLARRRVTVLHTVPTLLRQLLRRKGARDHLATIRAVDLAGEALFASDVALMREVLGDSRLVINHYAATEASVIAQHRVDFGRPYGEGPVPIGTPAAGMTVDILDESGRPARPGEEGEIVLTSAHLSPGYWNREALTRQRFAAVDEASGTRRYFTADRGWRDASGELHYLGRADAVVKVRGYSVDPGEIENALMALPFVEAAAVTAATRAGEREERELHAHVVPCAGEDLEEGTLRRVLSERLPDYMIPALITTRISLPLTPSGKVDRQRLAAETAHVPSGTVAHHCARDEVERTIADMFARVLGRASVGRDARFYDLGGDSLGMHELMTAVAAEYGVEIPFETLAADATPASLALWVRQRRGARPARDDEEQPASLIFTVSARPGAPNLFLLHGRNAHAFVSPHFVRVLAERVSVRAVRARGLRPGEEPHLSIAAMADDYAAEIRTLQPRGPYLLASVCAGGAVATETASRLAAAGEAVAPVIAIDPPAVATGDGGGRHRPTARELSLPNPHHAESARTGRHGAALARMAARGSIRYDAGDDDALAAASATQQAFSFALRNSRPSPYDGEVLALVNSRRLRKMRKEGGAPLPGRLRYVTVAYSHQGVFDVRNERTVKVLRSCLDYALRRVTGTCPEMASAATLSDARPVLPRSVGEWRLLLDTFMHRHPVLRGGSRCAGSLLRRLMPGRRQANCG